MTEKETEIDFIKFVPSLLVVITVIVATMIICAVTVSSNGKRGLNENESSMLFTLYKRIKNIETKHNIEVPKELKFTVNGELEK